MSYTRADYEIGDDSYDGYDNACETILDGAADVAEAVGLDAEFFCGEGALAYEISRGLSQIAEIVKNMPELYGRREGGHKKIFEALVKIVDSGTTEEEVKAIREADKLLAELGGEMG